MHRLQCSAGEESEQKALPSLTDDGIPASSYEAVALNGLDTMGVEIAPENVPRLISWQEMKLQCSLAWPLILSNILYFSLQLVSTVFVGRIGELEFAGASVAYSFVVITGHSILIGLNCALETLCGQANGAGHHKMVGIFMQRGMTVLTVVAMPVAVLWIFTEPLLRGLGQDPDIASKAGDYTKWLIPSLFAYAFHLPLSKFLQAQSLVIPLFAAFGAALIFHVPLCWLLVFKSSLGFVGAALASSISFWFIVVLLATYVLFSPACAKCRASFSLQAFQDLKGLLKLAVPSASMVCLEWWYYEVLVVVSGFLSNPKLNTAIIGICVSTETMLYMIPFGLSTSISIRVSNALGAGQPQLARRAIYNVAVLGLTEALLVALVLVSARNVWGHIYSNAQEVINAVADVIPLLATSVALDSLQAAFSGVIRGAGWQRVGAVTNLCCFYVAGLPIGCLLAFMAHRQAKGLWTGVVVAVSIQASAFTGVIHLTNWEAEVSKAAARVSAPIILI
ncbi:hypothetical protein L7F22_049491 [Adiantum nelumboides]|nr:hypothetical protein [Adiantum nelumboides]